MLKGPKKKKIQGIIKGLKTLFERCNWNLGDTLIYTQSHLSVVFLSDNMVDAMETGKAFN